MWLKPPSPRPSLRIYALSRPRCTNCILIGPISVVVWCGNVQQTCMCTVKPGRSAMATASSKRHFSSIGSDGSCAVPTSRRCHLCQEAWSSFQPRSAKPVPYESAVPPVAMGAVSAFTLTKRCCANSASANSRRWDETSYVNGSLWNMRLHISDTGRDGVPAIEASAKISSTCDAAPSFTIYMSLLVLWLFRTPPDYLTDVLARRLAEQGAHVVGVDLSRELLQIAHRE